MSTFGTIAAVVMVSAWSVVSFAQDSAPPPPTPAPPPAAEAEAPPTQPGAAASDEEFIPTEELSADEAVTFPVDI